MKRGAFLFVLLFVVSFGAYSLKDSLFSAEDGHSAVAPQFPAALTVAKSSVKAVTHRNLPENFQFADDSTTSINLAIKDGNWDYINGDDILAVLLSDPSLKETFYRSVHNKPIAQIIKAQQIVFQMENTDRELFANILLESPNADARVYGYEILASANMDAAGINPHHLNRVIDATYYETDPIVVSGILSTMATRFIDDENLPRFKVRALELARSENREVRFNATLALIKLTEDPDEAVKRLIRNQLVNGDEEMRGALLSELHTVSVFDSELIAEVEKIVVDPSNPVDLKEEAGAVLQHWRLAHSSQNQ